MHCNGGGGIGDDSCDHGQTFVTCLIPLGGFDGIDIDIYDIEDDS